jgi:hypothetical protein
MRGLRRLLMNQHVKVKSNIKTRISPVFTDPPPFGYGFQRGSQDGPDDLTLWQIWYNRRLAQTYSDAEMMSGIHRIEYACRISSFVSIADFISLGAYRRGIWGHTFRAPFIHDPHLSS